MLSIELLDKHIEECKEYVAAGKESGETLLFLENLRKDLEHANTSDWDSYNDLAKHLPNDAADASLIIIRGQLLIEGLVKRFVESRLSNPKALTRHKFKAAEYLAIAESMCLDNDEPRWLWTQLRELNAIRNNVAHELESENISKRINNFVSTVTKAQRLENRSLSSVIARLYGMVKGLCDLSISDDFRYPT